jgi:uncharacterized glyoxalase superfamily protein PhnB
MSKVKPIPDGMAGVTPHLTVKGAARAIEFYKKAFGAIERSRFPMPDGSIMHASLKIGEGHIYVNDEIKDMGAKSPQTLGGTPVAISIFVTDADATFKAAVAAGAKVKIPIADQFWGDRYGMVEDPFGHQWEISTHKEDLTPQEMERRGREAMAQMAKK